MAGEKEATERKTVTLGKGIWERIANYRFEHRISTEREAVERLIEAGLKQAERRKGKP